jgi:glycosyltransferase involved in cell wall biosynthesis
LKFSIIIPSLNERDNIPLVVERLEKLLPGENWEIVFVDDDSQDGSWEVLMELAREKPRVRFIRRIGRRGLASACLEGMASSAADVFAVMDCDLQHDETILPAMLRAFEEDSALELVVGSRYTGKGGGTGDWSKSRVFVSRFATRIGSIVRKTELTDPMSGFFAIRRNIFEETVRQMTGKGFKILLDIVLSAGRPLRVRVEAQAADVLRMVGRIPARAHRRHLHAALRCHRHQRRHVSPQVETAEVPTRAPHPRTGSPHVLHDQRDVMASRLARFALDAKAGIE